ncbi:MAG: hypothetical protein E8D40_10030 [Nitrospira sp.]|nr:MAG: hypothetical protein E8D40_10030 [Nitrospira sp.]
MTARCTANAETVVRLLNEALATEVICILRYKRHYFMTAGVNGRRVKAKFLQYVAEEQGHADLLAERIVQLGGKPDLSTERLLIRSHADRILRIEKAAMLRMLHEQPRFSEAFMSYLLTHSIRVQEDLVDQLFNSSEKRLARALLLLAHFGKEGKPETVIAKISQETLAEMVGTTRSRVSFFMNKFRKLGFIDYKGGSRRNGGLHVHSSLLNVVLHD